MINRAIVTEGHSDQQLLSALLEPRNEDRVRFFAAGGVSAADSLARSLLMTGAERVALVIDSDSRDPNLVDDRRRFYTNSLREVAPNSRILVIVVEPEIEALLFSRREAIPEAIRDRVTDTDFTAAYYEPKKVLAKVLRGESTLKLLSQLTEDDRKRLRALPEARQLNEFVSEVALGSRSTG